MKSILTAETRISKGLANRLLGALTLTVTIAVFVAFLPAQSSMPPAKLEPVFDLHMALSKPNDIGQTSSAGLRRASLSTGTIIGTGVYKGMEGKILSGADYQIIRPDGYTELDARYLAQMDNGDMLYMTNKGMRRGPADILAKLNAGEKIDQSKIYFRTVISVETASKKYDWMNGTIMVAVGERLPTEAILHVYRLD